jgi:hypothetical protein
MIGFIVAIALFTGSFYYLTQATIDREADTATAEDSNVQQHASALAEVLLQAGDGWYSQSPCVVVDGTTSLDSSLFDPDGVSDAGVGRFGLGEEECLRDGNDPRARNNLSYSKLYNLFYNREDADSGNGYVDYDEAKNSLGLEDEQDFHVRTWPVLATVAQILGQGFQDPTIRPLYIGDYHDPASVTEEVPYSYSVVDGTSTVTIKLTITNDGLTASIFATLFEIPLDKNNVGFTLHTPLLQSGQSHTVQFTLRKSSDWDWNKDTEKWITFEIQDRDGSVGDGKIDLSNVNMNYLTAQTNVFVESDDMYWAKDSASSVTIKMNHLAFSGDGSKKKFSDWKLVTTTPLGVPLTTVTLADDVFDGVSSQTAVLTGAYKGDVKNDLLLASWNIDYMNVVASDSVVYGYTTLLGSEYIPATSVASEGAYIDVLIRNFDNGVYSADYDSTLVPYAVGGDIFPDVKSVMNYDLVDALTDDNGDPSYDYTMIIVGSDIDQNAMTSASAKTAIANWVLGGGTLMVFGSDEQNIQWLQPLFHASQDTANGGLQTPDEGHPVLHIPNDLDYGAYGYETQWGYNAGAESSFTHVISTGSGGDVIAVGNPGAFGDGRVILSSYRPFDLVDDQATACAEPITADCEALLLLHNMVTLSYRYLYLDYGPEIPTDAAVGSTLRIVSVYHPDLRELVTLQLQVFVFD